MNARALRRFELSLPNDPFAISATPFQVVSDVHTWRTLVLNLATLTVNLPLSNGSGTEIWFVFGVVATSIVIKCSGSDVYQGFIDIGVVGSTSKNVFTAGGTANMTFNGTTKGGANKGDLLTLTAYASGIWSVSNQVVGTGTPATPFS